MAPTPNRTPVAGRIPVEGRVARKSLVLSAAARPGIGGQGLNLSHMIEGLHGDFDVTLFARAESNVVASRTVPPSRALEVLGRVPLIRRASPVLGQVQDVLFDRYVASHMPSSEVFQGAIGQCAESLDAARRLGARTVLDVVNMHVDQVRESADRECALFGVPSILPAWMVRRMHSEYERADIIRVMSHAAKRSFAERGAHAEKVFVATPFLDGEVFPEAKFDGPTFRVAFVGLMAPWKGFHHLVEAFDQFPERDAQLVFWGGTGARSIAQYMATAMRREPRISLRPASVRSVGLEEVYGKASVLVLPSVTDGFGYAAGEAMASGLPVIITPTAGAVDLVEDGVNGYVVPPRDPGAIRERLVHLASNPALLHRMGAAARVTAQKYTRAAFRESHAGRILAL